MTGGFLQDDYSVLTCASLVDEIWVPTKWHQIVFENILKSFGFSAPMIAIIPEAVDTTLFDPSLVPTNRFIKFRSNNSNELIESIESNGSNNFIEFTQMQPIIFEFLSIFKWEYRKGWDILLNAYWIAFKSTDNVVLRLRTYVPSSDRHTNKNITKVIENYAIKLFNKTLFELPKIIWETSIAPTLTRYEIRELYASADAFILPTRGEGWGLPIAEAMSMKLPVIITNYSGPTEFINENNCYLIPILDELDDLSYAQPNMIITSELMKQVVNDTKHNNIAELKGIEARKRMQELSPEYAVKLMNERLRYLALRRGWKL